MIGVTHITSKWYTHQFAAEMIFQSGTNDLPAVEQVLRTNESDHRIGEQRLEFSRDCIRTRFAGLLIDAKVRVGRKRATLAGFKVHDVLPNRSAPQRERRLLCLPQYG